MGASNRKLHEILRGLWSVSPAGESGRSKAAKTGVPRLWGRCAVEHQQFSMSEMDWLPKLSNKKALAAKPDKRIEQKRKFRLRHPPVVRS